MAKALSWFITIDLRKYLEIIKKECLNLKKQCVNYITKYYAHNGLEFEVIDTWISIFSNSLLYDEADFRFDNYIFPQLERMANSQIIQLIGVVNENDQIYDRRKHNFSCIEIYKVAKEKLPKDFCFDDYKHFYIEELETNQLKIVSTESDV